MKPQFEITAADMRLQNRTPKSVTGIRKRRQRVELLQKASSEDLRTDEVARLSGATLRQLQWWDEQNHIAVRQANHSRIYTPSDTAMVIAVMKLRKVGIRLARAFYLAKNQLFAVDSICESIALLKHYGIRVK